MSTTLKATPRERLGSRFARRLRLQNQIPASIQGEGKPNRDVSVDADEFAAARRKQQHLFDLDVAGEPETVMVRELQWSSLGRNILHIEFRRVVRGQKTEVEVQLEFSGHPVGGVLNHLLTHATVRCLPSEIPNSIEVRVDGLEVGHTLLAGDLVLPKGVELAMDPETQVASVATVRSAEPVEEGEGEAAEEGAAPAGDAPEASPESD